MRSVPYSLKMVVKLKFLGDNKGEIIVMKIRNINNNKNRKYYSKVENKNISIYY